MRDRSPFRFLLVASVLAAAAPASGSLAEALDLGQLVERSSVVAVISVESADARWLDGRIVTDSVATVTEGVSGATAGERLVVRTLGGEVDGVGQRVFGEPLLVPGGRYLLFAAADGGADGISAARASFLRPVGMAQGASPVVAGPEGDLVEPSPELPELVDLRTVRWSGAWLAAPRLLADVLVEVRDAIRRSGP
jgi:hypothetical protein